MESKVEAIINKEFWDKKEINNIDNVLKAVDVKPKKLSYDAFQSNFVEFDGKKFDGILRHRLYDWFDIAKIIEFLQLEGASLTSIQNKEKEE